jgi:lysophospholipid acyltransferase (LPLAT)-like uncharacterized protein
MRTRFVPHSAVPKNTPTRHTKLSRRVKKAFTRPLLVLARWLLPVIYVLYMKFVYLTSKVEHVDTDLLWALRDRYGGLVGTMWHQEVFMVAWSFRQYEGHTLASESDFGDLITAMLKMNGFVVIRGGGKAPRGQRVRKKVLPQLIEHMRQVPGVAYGITCDGSRGPPYVIKKGSIQIAHACHKPMMVIRTWCKRKVTLSGWDRAVIPLPFNHIMQTFVGPYFPPANADDPEVLEEFRQHLEQELLELTWWTHERVGDLPPEPRHGFPPGWTPSWGEELPRYPLEAPADHPSSSQLGAQPVGRRAQRRQAAAVERRRARDSRFSSASNASPSRDGGST